MDGQNAQDYEMKLYIIPIDVMLDNGLREEGGNIVPGS